MLGTRRSTVLSAASSRGWENQFRNPQLHSSSLSSMEFTEYSTFYVGQLSQGHEEDEEKLSLTLTTDR